MLVKTEEEIAIMREGCQILASVFDMLVDKIVPGATGLEVDAFAEAQIRAKNCIPAFKGYDSGGPVPFPATVCFSRNHEIVHGIPTAEDVIQDTDLVKIDMGLFHRGYCADMARTFIMPKASQEAKDLAAATKGVFEAGIAQLRDGARLDDFSGAAEEYARKRGYGVVRNLVGHGIGQELHMPPQVPNYVDKNFENYTFHAGMTLAIEPMVNIGTDDAVIGEDGWTFVTADMSLSAHYENTVLITKDGCEILTVSN